MTDYSPGHYDVVLGVSTKYLRIDKIKSIMFSISTTFKEFGPCEVFSSTDLELLSSESQSRVVKCKLHHQLQKNLIHPKVIMMEVRTAAGVSSSSDAGFLELHFMELRASRPEGYLDEPPLHLHRPYVWSLDIGHSDNFLNNHVQEQPPTIIHYAISGDGSYAATLAATESQLLLDIWDMEPLEAAHTGPPLEQPASTGIALRHPPCAGIQAPLTAMPDTLSGCPPFTVSVSWDGAYIALGDASAMAADPKLEAQFKSVFCIYSLVNKRASSSGQQSKKATLELSNAYQHCPGLVNFRGYGKFHVATTTGQEVENELFVTCDKGSINVYSTHGKWRHIRTFAVDEPLNNPRFNIPSSWRLIKSLAGKLCVWVPSSDYEVMVWDIEVGSMVSFSLWQQTYSLKSVLDKVAVSLSSDGSMLVIYRGRCISTHWTVSGTLLGSYSVPVRYEAISDVQFIDGDTRILVNANAQDEAFGQGVVGFILDTVKMSLVETFSVPGDYVVARRPSGTGEGQQLYSSSATTLDLLSLPSRILRPIVKSPSELATLCDEQCELNLSPLGKLPNSFTSASGVHFSVNSSTPSIRRQGQDIELPSVVLTMSDARAGSCRKFVIHPIRDPFNVWEDRTGLHNDPWKFGTYALLEASSELVIASRFLLMVWSLPSDVEENPILRLAWCLSRVKGELSHNRGGLWTICPHQRLFARRRYSPSTDGKFVDQVVMRPRVSKAFRCEYGSSFQEAIIVLIDNLQAADGPCKAAILQYIVSVDDNSLEDPAGGMLAMLCRAWKPEAHHAYQQAITALLASSARRWNPAQHSTAALSPFQVLLDKAQHEPRANDLAAAVVQSCVRKMEQERDPYHLQPIISCLHELLDQKHGHTPLATWTLQKLAYVPVKSRRVVLEYHVIAHPPKLRWNFWRPNLRLLDTCKDPVLHLGRTKSHNGSKSKFVRPLFVTWFDLLWHSREDDLSSVSPGHGLTSVPQTVFSWIYSLGVIVWRRCTFQSSAVVKLHDFKPEMLENPAIIALIEYKWNTIGFQYWVVRFLCQCCFYLLVLTTVFIQVYGKEQPPIGVFITITVFSSIFLWLELAQLFKYRMQYFLSIYNAVDLAVFGLPLAGSINQLIIAAGRLSGDTPEQGNAALYSFSVLFIFLHFLFELRVSSRVCQFVTIIINIISEIRLFFVIFAGGILAFAIATLHIIHSCPFESCVEPETSFSRNFYFAATSTYFFMGGRYDPISEDLESANWPFHALMVVYFFFTVILMLNVLIAIINAAFTFGDGTQAYEWFPNEIYYPATAKQVEAFSKSKEDDPITADLTRELLNNSMMDKDDPFSVAVSDLRSEKLDPRSSPEQQYRDRRDELQEMQPRQDQEHEEQRLTMKELEKKLEEHQLQLQRQLKQQQDLFEEQSELLTDRLQQGFEEQLARQQENHEAQLALVLEQISVLLNTLQ
ncbi:hypothetical protein BGZ68_007126 [Mortierella alpina]|nr:hypothetical protein BGZ68_007126 [Mortierella alpina]